MMKPATTFAWILGIVFLLVGILGFFTNPIVGVGGYFVTNNMHDWVHLATGIVSILVALASEKAANWFLNIFGLMYLIIGGLGFMMIGGFESTDLFGLITVNTADNWLHLGLGIVILLLGWSSGSKKIV